jgi:hypothetical protein
MRRLIQGTPKYPEKIQNKKINFPWNFDFSVQFRAPSGKLGIFTEKACLHYHIVAVKTENFPGCIRGK